MNYESSEEYGKEACITLISIPTCRVLTMDPMLFCINTGVSTSSIGDKALKSIFYSVGRKSIPIIQSVRGFQLGDTVIKSKGSG